MVAPVVLVAVGGACGAVLRWSVAPSPDAEGVPWGTLGVNLLGSLLLGAMTVLLAALPDRHERGAGPRAQQQATRLPRAAEVSAS